MDAFIKVIGILVLVAIAWAIIAAMFRSWLGAADDNAESKFWNLQAEKTREREALLAEAIATGDYSKYNATRAKHEKEFTKGIRALVDQETCIDENTQRELDEGINPYIQSPAPRGKLVRKGNQHV